MAEALSSGNATAGLYAGVPLHFFGVKAFFPELLGPFSAALVL